MARSAIRFHKQQGQFNTRIAELVGCDRHTVARVLGETAPPGRRARRSTLDGQRDELLSWLREDIPTQRMLELARQNATTPYHGGVSTFYTYVARLRAELAAGAAPVIRFEGLPGEYVQWDWGEARIPLGGTRVKRVFLCGRLKYSRLSGVRWRTQMDLETLCRAMLEIVEGWGGVPWAWVFDNMKTVTLGREAGGQPRWNPAFWRFATEVGFHPELCDPGAAQQKGTVENLVKWVKSNFLPGRRFADDEDLATQSLAWEADKAQQLSQAHGRPPAERLPAEQAAFGALTTTAATYGLYRVATVNRESLVRVDGNQCQRSPYSEPPGSGKQSHPGSPNQSQPGSPIWSHPGAAIGSHPAGGDRTPWFQPQPAPTLSERSNPVGGGAHGWTEEPGDRCQRDLATPAARGARPPDRPRPGREPEHRSPLS